MINILSMIKREMNRKHISAAELARKINHHQSTVQGMLNRNTIQVQKLADLCEVFQYNFFREIALEFPYDEPSAGQVFKEKELAFTEEINRIKEENKILKIKIEVLEQVIGKLK